MYTFMKVISMTQAAEHSQWRIPWLRLFLWLACAESYSLGALVHDQPGMHLHTLSEHVNAASQKQNCAALAVTE